jgi:hypothetical protein
MLITDKIAWAHIPKTGGSHTIKLFDRIFNVHAFAKYGGQNYDRKNLFVVAKGHDKHKIFRKYGSKVHGKQRIVNFRPLVQWITSWMYFNERVCNIPFDKKNYRKGKIFCQCFDFEGCKKSNPKYHSRGWMDIDEFYKSYITDPAIYEFIEMENLNESFIEIIGKYHLISDQHKLDIRSEEITAIGHYHKREWPWTKEEEEQMYLDNPYYAEVEKYVNSN